MNNAKRFVRTPLGAGALAAVTVALALTLIAVLTVYAIGGTDAVTGNAHGLWGLVVVQPTHTAMLTLIRACIVAAAVTGVLVGTVVAVARHEEGGDDFGIIGRPPGGSPRTSGGHGRQRD